jgi:signal transduction histidine kinase
MKAYRVSAKLKIGLILFAIVIAVVSLAYTHQLVNRLKDREQSVVRLWANALVQLPKAQLQSVNPYQAELSEIQSRLRAMPSAGESSSADRLPALLEAISWAQSMPPASELSFIMDDILVPNAFDIPAIVTDDRTGEILSWRNLHGLDSAGNSLSSRDSVRMRSRIADMDSTYAPIPIEITFPGMPEVGLKQQVHYGESQMVRELRWYPYIQFLFVGLFILVGYLGFSYVRRSEQSSLWVGMAKEAAHQLGTPISSLMGWTEILRSDAIGVDQRRDAVDEVEKDVERLKRVASRFSDIGSMPRLSVESLESVVGSTVDYMQRRLPRKGKDVQLVVDMEPGLKVPLNPELFEWVVENLLKNALDALEGGEGRIEVRARREGEQVHVDVEDTGKGIDRREWKFIFRPGFSTKTRGWGLGLSLAKRIVEDYHGGELILLQSRPGHGSTFRISIPSS